MRTGRHCRRCPLVLVAEINPALGKIIRGHFYRDPIAGKNSNSVLLHSAGGISKGLVTVVELHTKTCVGKQFEYCTFKLDQIFLSQRDLLEERRRAPVEAPPQILARFRPRAN